MKYVLNRNVKQRLIKYLQYAFIINKTWLNTDIEVVDFSSGSISPTIDEHYPWDAEKYPIVAVAGTGTTEDKWAIDDYAGNDWDVLKFGSEANSYSILDNSVKLGCKIVDTSDTFKIRDVQVALKQYSSCDYDVYVELYSASGSLPDTCLASGSISSEDLAVFSSSWGWGASELWPEVTLEKNDTYFLMLSLYNGHYGKYYAMVDSSPNSDITPEPLLLSSGSSTGWTTYSGSTLLSYLEGPVSHVIGGGSFVNYSLFIEAKELGTVQKISELASIYLNLLKYANIQVPGKLDYPNATNTEYTRMGKLSDLGIYLFSVSAGSEGVRERGNDRLFSIVLNVQGYGNWAETFEMPTLLDIQEIINIYQ